MNIFEGLNDRQKQVVEHIDGPLLVVAGAGAGKTKALTHRIANLMGNGVSPYNILAVTFTNKAAMEMKSRVAKLLDLSLGNVRTPMFHSSHFPVIGTFHSICIQILRQYIAHIEMDPKFTIYDSMDQLTLVKRVMKSLNMDDKKFKPKVVLAHISNAKNELIDYKTYESRATEYFETQVAQVYKLYQIELFKSGALDFDDIIMKTVQLFQVSKEALSELQERFKYISVDEYQDTNYAQYTLIRMLAEKYNNICVIGDSDQSIYSWRGADIRNILSFEKDYGDAKVVKLEQNYRSTKVILDCAHKIIEKNTQRRDKKLWTDNAQGAKIQVLRCNNEVHEAETIVSKIENRVDFSNKAYSEFCILYRTNAQSRALEEACLRHGIPYKIIGGVKFYARKEIKDVIAYLQLIQNNNDNISFLRIINNPSRKLGAKTLADLQQLADKHQVSLLEAILKYVPNSDLASSKKKTFLDFANLILNLKQLSTQFSPAKFIQYVIDQTGYKHALLAENSIEGQTRYENIQELISVATKYNDYEKDIALGLFLEEISLISDTDSLVDGTSFITLMTLHSAKGLEYNYIYIAGMEEGIFPHQRSHVDPSQMEEERRLMYVGVTRACKELCLLFARQRMVFGEFKSNSPSQFLSDIPERLVEGNYNEPVKTSYLQQTQRQPVTFTPSRPVVDSEPQVVYDRPNLSIGDQIEHKVFGRGSIVRIMGDVATITFQNPRLGTKKLALSVAPIQKV